MKRTEPFIISRVLEAPRGRVWQAWTEAERLKHWWGPKGFTVKQLKLDLRVGGKMHYCLQMPDGNEMWGLFVYRQIVPQEKLVFVNSFSDPKGGITTHPMSPTWPREMLSTITFEAQGGKTGVTVRWVPLEGSTELERKTFEEGRDSMKTGWTGTMDQFAAYLANAK